MYTEVQYVPNVKFILKQIEGSISPEQQLLLSVAAGSWLAK